MLSGCGGSQPPIGTPGAMQQTSAIATHAERGKSWVLPEASGEDLLYASTPVCPGQKRTAKYASVIEAISKKPTELCVPSFKGFGGFIGFPAAHPPGKLSLMTSDKPVHHGLPNLKGIAPVFYLEWDPGWQMTLGKVAPAGGVFGKDFTPGHIYTAYGEGEKDGGTDRVGPCYSVAVEGKYGGVFRNLGSLVTGQTDSVFAWTLGIYPGKEANHRCGSKNR